MCSVTFEDLLV